MAQSFKLSSVKRLLLLGVVQGVPENYYNVKTILEELNIEALDYTVSADIKMCKLTEDVDKLILEILCVPELHLLLGNLP